jgi:hypothetical protein
MGESARELAWGVAIVLLLAAYAFDVRGMVQRVWARFRGKNGKWTSTGTITEQMRELRALPMGVQEFHEWADRIISGACIPGATPESQKFALAEMIMHLKPTQDHCDDAHFIHTLRKGAVNEVAWAMMKEIRETRKPETKVPTSAETLAAIAVTETAVQ